MTELSIKADAVLNEIPFTWTNAVLVWQAIAENTGLSNASLAQRKRGLYRRGLYELRAARPDDDHFVEIRRCPARGPKAVCPKRRGKRGGRR